MKNRELTLSIRFQGHIRNITESNGLMRSLRNPCNSGECESLMR